MPQYLTVIFKGTITDNIVTRPSQGCVISENISYDSFWFLPIILKTKLRLTPCCPLKAILSVMVSLKILVKAFKNLNVSIKGNRKKHNLTLIVGTLFILLQAKFFFFDQFWFYPWGRYDPEGIFVVPEAYVVATWLYRQTWRLK